MMRAGQAPVRILVGRFCATQAAQRGAPVRPRPYHEIPGPRAVPIVGNKFRFLPGFRENFLHFKVYAGLFFAV